MRSWYGIVALVFLIAVFGSADRALGQEVNCQEVEVMAKMARANSVAVLRRIKEEAGTSYSVESVFAARQFELKPTSRQAALRLLDRIPTRMEDQAAWIALTDWSCNGEPEQAVRTLANLESRLPRDLSSAVLVAPEKMQTYVEYAAEAVADSHSDYAMHMRRVCREKHAEFARAVSRLRDESHEPGAMETADSDWFRVHILDPHGCRVKAFPEAD